MAGLTNKETPSLNRVGSVALSARPHLCTRETKGGVTDGIPESGIYVLVIRLPRACRVRAGSLGDLALRKGYYAYVGRAKRGLPARLARHAHKEGKRLRWHIDYLMEVAVLKEAWVFPVKSGECDTASELEACGGTREGLQGFGSSDCRCPGHLLYFKDIKPQAPPGALILSISDSGPSA